MQAIMVSMLLIFISMIVLIAKIKRKKEDKRIEEIIDTYTDDYVTELAFSRLRKNRLIGRLAKTNKKYETLFNNAKNPWGITPAIYKMIRFASVLFGIFLAVFLYFLTRQAHFAILGAGIGFILWYYPYYYYKGIGTEREQEWDKVYEFIWLIRNSLQIYSAKKTFVETVIYIEKHYPHYKELIRGFKDFHNHWGTDSEYIKKYYNFALAKELYNIIFEMEQTGMLIDDNLENLRVYALDKHKGKIQKQLSGVTSKATLASLPCMLLSCIIALSVPMVVTFMTLM